MIVDWEEARQGHWSSSVEIAVSRSAALPVTVTRLILDLMPRPQRRLPGICMSMVMGMGAWILGDGGGVGIGVEIAVGDYQEQMVPRQGAEWWPAWLMHCMVVQIP